MHYSQPDKPEMRAVETGFLMVPDYESRREPLEIQTAEWNHIASCRFGEPRASSSNHNWSGDSYRYDIFVKGEGWGSQVALRSVNGGGTEWLVDRDDTLRHEMHLLRAIVTFDDEARRWDMAHKLWESVHKTALASSLRERQILFEAFCDGRLKRRKRGNVWRMEILPKVEKGSTGFSHVDTGVEHAVADTKEQQEQHTKGHT